MNTAGKQVRTQDVIAFDDPPVAKALFGNTRWAWIWLILRLYAGYEWLSAGVGKVQSPVWVGGQAGVAITGFVKGALAKTAGWWGWTAGCCRPWARLGGQATFSIRVALWERHQKRRVWARIE